MAETGPSPVVLFDGVCNYCNGLANFLIRQDKKKRLKFAAIQSEAGKRLLIDAGLPEDYFDSFVLIDKGHAYLGSTAGLRLYNKLPWYWKWTQVFWIFPRFIRDGVYNIIARNRYKWWGKRDHCMIPTSDVRERFIED